MCGFVNKISKLLPLSSPTMVLPVGSYSQKEFALHLPGRVHKSCMLFANMDIKFAKA